MKERKKSKEIYKLITRLLDNNLYACHPDYILKLGIAIMEYDGLYDLLILYFNELDIEEKYNIRVDIIDLLSDIYK